MIASEAFHVNLLDREPACIFDPHKGQPYGRPKKGSPNVYRALCIIGVRWSTVNDAQWQINQICFERCFVNQANWF